MSTQSHRKFSAVKVFVLCIFAFLSFLVAASPNEFDIEEQEAEIERLIVQTDLENEIKVIKEMKEDLNTPLSGEPGTPTPEKPCAFYPKCCSIGGCP